MENQTESKKRQLLNRSLLIAGLLFIIFFIYVIYAANRGSLPLFIRRIYMFPGGDKVGHIVLLALLTFFSNWLFRLKVIEVSQYHLLLGSLVIFLLITVEEFSQLFLTSVLSISQIFFPVISVYSWVMFQQDLSEGV